MLSIAPEDILIVIISASNWEREGMELVDNVWTFQIIQTPYPKSQCLFCFSVAGFKGTAVEVMVLLDSVCWILSSLPFLKGSSFLRS